MEIKEGGTSLIRITDNGCGIEAAQIPIAFYRHSTSKIRKVEDLVRISSLGFRGEALSSIAAVAQVELITKTPEQFTGSRYLIEGGKEVSLAEIGAPNGTTFLVKNLFYNTPVRRKFLKSAQTEAGYVNDLMERIALSHPEISFKFINNGQIRLHTSGNGKLKDIIYHIYGRDIAANLLEIHAEYEGFSVDGFIGKPIIARGNRNFESYFINGRYIKSTLIAKALEDGYRGFMMQHKYPFTVLTISLDGTLVDVNVHPNKMELRFSNGEILYQQLAALLSTRLRESELIPKVTVHEEKKQEKRPQIQPQEAPEPFEQKRLERLRAAVAKDSPYERKYPERNRPETGTSGQETVGQASVLREQITYGTEYPGSFPVEQKLLCEEKTDSSETQKQEKNGEVFFPESVNTDSQEVLAEHALQQTLFDAAEQKAEEQADTEGSDFSDADLKSKQEWKLLSKQARPHHRIIGQLFETYWLVEYQEQFYMIDQHAAHEKVLFERTMKAYREKEFTSQMISPPIILSLTMQEEVLLKKFLPEFEKLGYEIEHFGGKEYAVNAVPGNLYGLNGQSLLLELMDGLGNMSEKDTPDLVVEKIASMSCKAAVKGNQKLSRPEIEHLIDELLTLENPYFCPHGRPVIVSMTKYEIEKKFKRIV